MGVYVSGFVLLLVVGRLFGTVGVPLWACCCGGVVVDIMVLSNEGLQWERVVDDVGSQGMLING